MTLEDITRLEALEREATRQPWCHIESWGEIQAAYRQEEMDAGESPPSGAIAEMPKHDDRVADFEFIVELRNAAPELLRLARAAMESKIIPPAPEQCLTRSG